MLVPVSTTRLTPDRPGETKARRHSGLRGHQRGLDDGIYFENGDVTDGSFASGDLDLIRQWLVVNRQFLTQEWFPFRSITSCLEDGSGRKGTSLTTSCCGI
jgi:hypothetical protein